jgi:Holliday junction resolvase-like predicted endonuclease
MSQAIREAFGGGAEALSREAIKQSVESRYPGKWKPATLSAHLYACAINNPRAYVHHPHAERFLYKLADGAFELYDDKVHGPNLWAPDPAEDGSEEAEQAVEVSISLERDIEDQLVHRLDSLEKGLTFVERQAKCDVGRIDIVGRGADGATVVVELKVGEAKDSAIGQIARYMGWHQQHQGAGTVRGILVASDFPEGVQHAALAIPNLALRRYRIQLTFEDASLSTL